MLRLGKEIMIFDGGMGSELVKAGITYTVPEDLNVTHPDAIKKIHNSYIDADFVTTNTFGLNKIKYKGKYTVKEVAKKAIENARSTGKFVFFDIGPTGALLKPLGQLSFDDAYEAFKEVVSASKDKVDGYIIETFSDLYELKAAVMAVKENSDKPLFVTMTFDKSGRTLTGTTPEIMVAFLEGFGVDALGVNCSLGPKDLFGVVDRIIKCANVPVMVQPNRGIPELIDGRSHYTLTVEEFTESVSEFVKMGVSIVGGCCGTDPSFISSIAKFKGTPVARPDNEKKKVITSGSKLVEIGDETEFADISVDDSVTEDDCEDIAYDVLDTVDEGADVINLKIDCTDASIVRALVEKIQEICNVPLQFTSEDVDAIETAVRYYNGVPLIRFEGDTAKADEIVKKYGAKII